jgi:hypothetical protein
MPKYDELLRAPRRPSEHQQHSEVSLHLAN